MRGSSSRHRAADELRFIDGNDASRLLWLPTCPHIVDQIRIRPPGRCCTLFRGGFLRLGQRCGCALSLGSGPLPRRRSEFGHGAVRSACIERAVSTHRCELIVDARMRRPQGRDSEQALPRADQPATPSAGVARFPDGRRRPNVNRPPQAAQPTPAGKRSCTEQPISSGSPTCAGVAPATPPARRPVSRQVPWPHPRTRWRSSPSPR